MDAGAGDAWRGDRQCVALPVAVAGLAVTLFGRSLRPSAADRTVLAAAARSLAGDVAEQEAAARQRLLSDTGDARPADVRFAQPAPSPLLWRSDGGERQGSLETVAEFYRGLARGRLVVLGEPGAGKTVLAIQVLLDLIRAALSRPESDDAVRVRVPVRLSLPAFPADGEHAPGVVRRRLDDWIAAHLVTAYGQRPAVARQLVAQGWILPVLDGLDEMDPDGAEPVRARAVAGGLNHPTGPVLRPVVVTCRTHLYQRLAEEPSTAALQDATTVVMQPLTAGQVVRWLAHRCGDPTQPDGVQRRWQPVITRVIRRPTGALAACLSSPLRLYLAVTAYQDPHSTPRELLTVPAADLDRHLLARLIPAVTASHPRPGGGRYHPRDLTRWLAALAHHLTWMGSHDESDTDLYLQTCGAPPAIPITPAAPSATCPRPSTPPSPPPCWLSAASPRSPPAAPWPIPGPGG
jgi:NACHT domain-containing protein